MRISIGGAIAVAIIGDLINVANGHYVEDVTLNNSINLLRNQFGVDRRIRLAMLESNIESEGVGHLDQLGGLRFHRRLLHDGANAIGQSRAGDVVIHDNMLSQTGMTIDLLEATSVAEGSGFRILDSSGIVSILGNTVSGQASGIEVSNADGKVDAVDFGSFRAAFNTMSPSANFNSAFDFNNDGKVDALDFGAFRTRFNTVI